MKPENDPNNFSMALWLVILGMACWGGIVRYLIDMKQGKASWSLLNGLSQVIVSMFAGVLAGLICKSAGLDVYWMSASAGVSGAMGSVAITYFWERFSGAKGNGNQ